MPLNEGFEAGLSSISQTTTGRQTVDSGRFGVGSDHTVREGIDQGTSVWGGMRSIAGLV